MDSEPRAFVPARGTAPLADRALTGRQPASPPRSRYVPPVSRVPLISRPRLDAILAAAAEIPLTIIKADAGYGKSTAAAALARRHGNHAAWYGLTSDDADLHVFLRHLFAAFETLAPGAATRAIGLLEAEGGAAKRWAAAVDALSNDLYDRPSLPLFVILDDWHLVDEAGPNASLDRLLSQAPPSLHVVMTTRQTPALPHLARRRLRGEVLELTRADLAFDASDTIALFEGAGLELTPQQATAIVTMTDGWPIAIQMLVQRLRDAGPEHVDGLIKGLPAGLDDLFAYLADEVLAALPPSLQTFLLRSSVLRAMEPALCDRLLGRTDSAAILRSLVERSLLVSTSDGQRYRYHPLFHEFLTRRLAEHGAADRARLHRLAVTLYRRRGDVEEAIYHALAAGRYRQAAAMLASVAAGMIQSGRYGTIADWIDALPAPIRTTTPELLLARGEAARLTSQFGAALEHYEAARRAWASRHDPIGESRAVEGAALVYLDTVQPRRAEPLIRLALRLVGRTDPRRREHLFWLLAENHANQGRLRHAERLQTAICRRRGRPMTEIDPRIYVRQGRFAEARVRLEASAGRTVEQPAEKIPRSHREPAAVLAWIAAFTGRASEARRQAEQALRRGHELRAPIVEAVAQSRLGHAWLTGPDADLNKAREAYLASMALADAIGIPRFRVEALLGTIVIAARSGEIELARDAARAALAILDDAGDRYLTSVVWLALGAAGMLTDHPQAGEWLDRGAALAERCGDRYGPTLADLWRAVLALRQQDWATFDGAVRRALRAAVANDHDALFTAQPLLGLHRRRDLERVLETAIERGVEVRLARFFLSRLAPRAPQIERTAPSTTPIVVRCLGRFRLWLGGREIPRRAWPRERALQLFQYLLGQAGRVVPREQIQEALWPEADPTSSALGLRVALNALRRTLEPGRARGAPPRFVRREAGGLVLDAELVRLDTDEFVAAARRGLDHELSGDLDAALGAYRQALAVYRGDYLEEQPYADWAAERRRELRDLYLSVAERAARSLLARRAYTEAEGICQQGLARDPAWEVGYELVIRAQAARDRRALALQTFERCRAALLEHLGVEPSPTLLQLRAEIARSVSRVSAAGETAAKLRTVELQWRKPARPSGGRATRRR